MTKKYSPLSRPGELQSVHTGAVERTHVALLDKNDPFSVLNVMPECMKASLPEIPRDWWNYGEGQIMTKLKPCEHVRMLRIMFWREYNRITEPGVGGKMHVPNIYTGVCYRERFYELVRDPKNVFVMMIPPVKYMTQMEDMLDQGMKKLKDVLKLPLKQKGKVNASLIGNIVKVVELLDKRVHGPQTTALIAKHQHEHIHREMEQDADELRATKTIDVEVIDEELGRINKAEQKKAAARGAEVEGSEGASS